MPFFILPLLALAGAAAQAIGMGLRAKAEADAAERNIAELGRAAKLEDSNAIDALRQGALLASQQRMRAGQMVGQQKTAFAAGGIDATVGTPAALASATSFWGEVDAQAAKNNAWRQAMGHRETARRYRAGIDSTRAERADSAVATGIGMGATMLNGATNAWAMSRQSE